MATAIGRDAVLLDSLGLEPESFMSFVEWILNEHLVAVIAREPRLSDEFFNRLDARKAFALLLREKTGRRWSAHDQNLLFQRVKDEIRRHYRDPIHYEEYLKLLWQVPWECVLCHRAPPDVKLHVDHIVPASKGGTSLRKNLQFLCAEHNLKKSN